MFLELALGQYAALGPSVVFDKLCPLFHGRYFHFYTQRSALCHLADGNLLMFQN